MSRKETRQVTIVKQLRSEWLKGWTRENKGLPRSIDKSTLSISVHEDIADEELDDWIRAIEYDPDFLYYAHRGDVSTRSAYDITNEFGAYAWIGWYSGSGAWQFADDWYD